MTTKKENALGVGPQGVEKIFDDSAQHIRTSSLCQLTRNSFLHDLGGRLLTILVGVAANASDDAAVDIFLDAKDRLNRRAKSS